MDKRGRPQQIFCGNRPPIATVEAVGRVISERQVSAGAKLKVAHGHGIGPSRNGGLVAGVGGCPRPRRGVVGDFAEPARLQRWLSVDPQAAIVGAQLHGIPGAATQSLDVMLVGRKAGQSAS